MRAGPAPITGVFVCLFIASFPVKGETPPCTFKSDIQSLLPTSIQFLISNDVMDFSKQIIRQKLGSPSRKVLDSWYYDINDDKENLLLSFESKNLLSFYRFRFASQYTTRAKLQKSNECWEELLQEKKKEIVPKLGVSQGKFVQVIKRLENEKQDLGEFKILFRNNQYEPLYSVEWRK